MLSCENYERIVEITQLAETMMCLIDNESLRHECETLGTYYRKNPAVEFSEMARMSKFDDLSDEDYKARVEELKSISDRMFLNKEQIVANYRGAMSKLKQDMTSVMEYLRELSILNKLDISMQQMRLEEILDPDSDCSWILDDGVSTMTDEELEWSQKMQASEGEWV